MDVGTSEVMGVWHRLALSVPGIPIDTTTQVTWLQAPVYYVDLRQPVGLGGRIAASCLNDVTPEEARLLATQEGFAGRLRLAGDEAEWLRAIDYRPTGLGDRGQLDHHGDLLIERGLDAEYIEHWQREPVQPHQPCGSGLFVSPASGQTVILVRHGDRFGYARPRTATLPDSASLLRLVAEAGELRARDLVDCEISLGTITPGGWRIDRSSLPWRVGAILLPPDAAISATRLAVEDQDPAGTPFRRDLALVELHGSLLPPREAEADLPAAALATRPTPAEPFTRVPVVDISALGGSDPVAEAATVEALRRAASEVGFLHVTGHGIAPAVIDGLRHAARRFFALPEAEKRASYIGLSGNHRGYVPEGEEALGADAEIGQPRDRKEAFDLALDLPAESVPAGHPLLGPNLWPDLPGFREDAMAYYGAAFAVGRRLLRGFALALGQPPESFERLVTTPPSQLRLIHYPHDASAADAPGIGAHTDYECFTLLLATAPGLEVMNPAGVWIDAPPVPGALVVNIGDMLEYWSDGRFVATSHRVRKVAEERWSFPLFFALDYDVALRPLGQPDADPIRTGDHLFAQTAQTFRYLRERVARGEVALPQGARPVSTFGQHARHAAHPSTATNPA